MPLNFVKHAQIFLYVLNADRIFFCIMKIVLTVAHICPIAIYANHITVANNALPILLFMILMEQEHVSIIAR